jgi:hypothetical protein
MVMFYPLFLFTSRGATIIPLDAVAVIRSRMLAYSSLTDVVSASKIMAGDLPLKTVLPAICIHEISHYERLKGSTNNYGILKTARIQVTVFAKTYPQKKALTRLIGAACANYRGKIADIGINVDSIFPDNAGPDMGLPDLDIGMQTQDFIVRYSEL